MILRQTVAPIDRDALAGDELGAVRSQEGDGLSHVLGLAHVLHRHTSSVSVLGFLRIVDVAFGGDPAGSDQVHGDLPGRQLQGPRRSS